MIKVKVVSYSFEDLNRETWTALENQARYLSIFQTYDWAEVLYSLGNELQFLIMTDKDSPVLGLQISKSRFASGIFSAYEAMKGPVVVSEIDQDIFPLFVSVLKKTIKKRSMLYFYWHPLFCINLERYVIDQGFSLTPVATFIIDLSLPIETLWRNLEKNTRWGVRKAERSQVKVVEADSWTDWNKYYNLYASECYRKHISPLSMSLHKSIHKFLLPEGKAKLFVAKHEGKIVAGTISLITSQEIVDWRGASNPRYLKMYPNNAVQWHSICWAKTHGVEFYDLGGTLWKPDKKSFLYGVHVWKKQWGGKLHKYNGFCLNKFFVIGRSLFFESSVTRRLYHALGRLRLIERSERLN